MRSALQRTHSSLARRESLSTSSTLPASTMPWSMSTKSKIRAEVRKAAKRYQRGIDRAAVCLQGSHQKSDGPTDDVVANANIADDTQRTRYGAASEDQQLSNQQGLR